MQFTAWATPDDKNYGNDPLGSAYITLYGTTPAYVPSNITLQSIDPAEGSVLGEETPVFTLNFDGMVAIDAKQTVISGGVASDNINFASITPVDPDVQNDITYASIPLSHSIPAAIRASVSLLNSAAVTKEAIIILR